jgi:hypothetical protein
MLVLSGGQGNDDVARRIMLSMHQIIQLDDNHEWNNAHPVIAVLSVKCCLYDLWLTNRRWPIGKRHLHTYELGRIQEHG